MEPHTNKCHVYLQLTKAEIQQSTGAAYTIIRSGDTTKYRSRRYITTRRRYNKVPEPPNTDNTRRRYNKVPEPPIYHYKAEIQQSTGAAEYRQHKAEIQQSTGAADISLQGGDTTKYRSRRIPTTQGGDTTKYRSRRYITTRRRYNKVPEPPIYQYKSIVQIQCDNTEA